MLRKMLFSMRSANYEKMYPEFKARVMLYATIVVMAVLAFICLIAPEALTSANVHQDASNAMNALQSGKYIVLSELENL